MDIGMYFSQVLMKNYPSLKWEQPLGNKRFADYDQPCLVGFGPCLRTRYVSGMSSPTGWRIKPTPAKDCEKFSITGQSWFERNLDLLRTAQKECGFEIRTRRCCEGNPQHRWQVYGRVS
jgi:hypothetical protein